MEQRKGFPDGVFDFKALVTGGYFFVDKTGLICDLCGVKGMVLLIARPRRFGKSLNLSMLDYFFNIDHAGEEDIFEGLEVSECEHCARYRNAFPVLNLNFGFLSGRSPEMFRESLRTLIRMAAGSIRDRIGPSGLGEYDRAFLERCIGQSLNGIEELKAFRSMCGVLKKAYGKDVLILVDEYDHWLQDIRTAEELDSISDDMDRLLEQTFKFNTDCEFAVATGILPATGLGTRCGFNNASVCSVLETEFDDRFGFTETEVLRLLEQTGSPSEKISEIMEWHGRYRFGNADVCNPYAVMRYIESSCRPGRYWTDTGCGLSGELVSGMGPEALYALKRMHEDKGCTVRAPLDTRVSWPQVLAPLAEPSAVCSFLALTGYLRATGTGEQADGSPLCDFGMVGAETSIAFEELAERAEWIEKAAADAMECIFDRGDRLSLRFESMLGCFRMDRILSGLNQLSMNRRCRDLVIACLSSPEVIAEAGIPGCHGLTGILFEESEGHPPVIIEVRAATDPKTDLRSLAITASAEADANSPDLTGAVCIGIAVCGEAVEAVFSDGASSKQ